MEEWYEPQYSNILFFLDKETNLIFGVRHSDYTDLRYWEQDYIKNMQNTFIDKTNKNKAVPLIKTPTSHYYECGFHFFDNLEDMYSYYTSCIHPKSNLEFMFCEFKERIVMGYQGTYMYPTTEYLCGVARKMRLLDSIPMKEVLMEIKKNK